MAEMNYLAHQASVRRDYLTGLENSYPSICWKGNSPLKHAVIWGMS